MRSPRLARLGRGTAFAFLLVACGRDYVPTTKPIPTTTSPAEAHKPERRSTSLVAGPANSQEPTSTLIAHKYLRDQARENSDCGARSLPDYDLFIGNGS